MPFIPNPEFAALHAEDAETKKAILEFADKALAAAQAIAPVQTGRYRDSLFADETGLGTTDSDWLFIEYGTVNEAPQAVLRKGVEGAGLVLTDP